MKKKIKLLSVILIISTMLTSCNQNNESQSNLHAGNESKFPKLQGPYLGQKPPGMTPEIFAPGIISTDVRELNSVFSPDGKEFYYTKRVNDLLKIFYLKEEKDGWTKPALTPFSADCNDFDMAFSIDGDRLFFCSSRPVPGSSAINIGYDIWYVQREGEDWGKPVYIEGPVNEGDRLYYPSLSSGRTLYFTTQRDDSFGQGDIYKAFFRKGRYDRIENLGPNVNTKYDEGDAFIAPDESYIIVCSTGRPEGLGSTDLYVSFQKEDGSWTKLKPMGISINSPFSDYSPYVSPDGRYFFFTSRRTGADDIYWVNTKAIDDLKPEEVK